MAKKRALTVKQLVDEAKKNYPNAVMRFDGIGPFIDFTGEEFPEDPELAEDIIIHMDTN